MREPFAGNASSDGGDNSLIARVRAVAFPALERDRLHLAKAERWLDRIEANRQVSAPSLRARRFIADEIAFAADRAFAPRDDYALRGVEMFLNVLAPMRAAPDVGVPPDAEAFRLQRLNERNKPCAILSFVRDKNIRRWTCHRAPGPICGMADSDGKADD